LQQQNLTPSLLQRRRDQCMPRCVETDTGFRSLRSYSLNQVVVSFISKSPPVFFHNTIDRNFVTSCSLFATNAVSEPIADTELVFPTQRNTNRLFVGSKRLFVSFVAPLSNSFSVPLQDPFRLFRKFIRGKRKHEFCFARAIACNRGWRRFGLGLGRKRRIWLGAHRRRFG